MTGDQRLPKPHDRYNALLDAMLIVARASGGVKMTDFTDPTWKMICEINKNLAQEAAKALG